MARRQLLWGVVALGLSACGGPSESDIVIDITFAGVVSCFQAGVDTVTVDWANNALPSTTIPCNSAGGVSVAYPNVREGTYLATIQGIDRGTVIYAGRGPIDVEPGLPTVFAFDVPFAQ